MAAPRRALVTGCAGFLGSHLCERLVDDGFDVVGVDCFSASYARETKEANVARLREEPAFELVEADLVLDRLEGLLEGVDDVYHLAGQTSVRASFGKGYRRYARNNVVATRRLMAAAARRPVLSLVYASSSSVYGNAPVMPVPETAPRDPISPYGATKAAAETLARGAWREHGVPAIGLRYFTAYGPRQRPDMAFHRFIAAAVAGRPVEVLGDGRQVRDFTYVADIVDATRAAADAGEPGAIYNVGGGQPVTVLEAIEVLEELLDRPVAIDHRPRALGDVRSTAADITLAVRQLGLAVPTPLADGLAAQVECALSRDLSRL